MFTFLDSADSGPTVRRTPWDWVADVAHILMNRKQRPTGAQDDIQPSRTYPPLEVHFLRMLPKPPQIELTARNSPFNKWTFWRELSMFKL